MSHLVEILMLKLIWFYYVTEKDMKNISHFDASFSVKSNLSNLKTEVDKLGFDKLKGLPINLDNLKSKVDKMDIDELALVPVDLSK